MPAAPDLPEAIHGEKVLVIAGVHAGDVEEGMKVLQPLRELGTPLADISQPLPFTAVQTAFDGFFSRGELQSYWKSSYLDRLPDAAIDAMVQSARARPVRPSEFEVAAFGRGSTYLNFSGRTNEQFDAGVDDALGRSLRRLVEVKAAYDPGNLFHRNSDRTRRRDRGPCLHRTHPRPPAAGGVRRNRLSRRGLHRRRRGVPGPRRRPHPDER
jgi:Berberine and berberine like